jgi:hypothetical protein
MSERGCPGSLPEGTAFSLGFAGSAPEVIAPRVRLVEGVHERAGCGCGFACEFKARARCPEEGVSALRELISHSDKIQTNIYQEAASRINPYFDPSQQRAVIILKLIHIPPFPIKNLPI